MARFPLKEAEVMALAQAMVSGLTANAVLYPAPPVLPAALTTLVSAYTTAKNAAIFAVQILAMTDEALAVKLADFRKKQAEKVMEKDASM